MEQSGQMTCLFAILLISNLFSMVEVRILGYVKRCPTRLERRMINRYSMCKQQPEVFHCTSDDYFNLVETCNLDLQLPPGNCPKYNILSDRINYEKCPKGTYQPWPVRSYEVSQCELVKSTCSGVGQISCDSGNSTNDATCGCDYKQGFVINGPSRCCSPSGIEDCFCQYQPCDDELQELNSCKF